MQVDNALWERLCAPFSFDDIEIKPQQVSIDKGKALAVPYINARSAMQRLDEVFGPASWKVEYREAHIEGGHVGIFCRLTIFLESGREVVREDGAELTDIESFKGGISSAFKRAFSALGNRSLYDVELGWQACKFYDGKNGKKFDGWTPEALKAMQQRYEKQAGIGQSRRSQERPEPKPQAAAPKEPSAPQAVTAPPEGTAAFGYSPKAWPGETAFRTADTVSQRSVARQWLQKREIPLAYEPRLRECVLAAYGLETDAVMTPDLMLGDSKAASILFIDFLQNASDVEHLRPALAEFTAVGAAKQG